MKAIHTLVLALSFIGIAGCATSQSKPGRTPAPGNSVASQDSIIPVCIVVMTEKYTAEEKQNPPRKIYEYRYKGRKVYYVTAPCCDFFSDLYDDNCALIGHPDGGITGRGDGTMTDFITARTAERLIWEDKRK